MSLKDAHFHQITTVHNTTAGTPLADQFEGTIYSDIVSMAKYNKIYFLVYMGAGGTGRTTLTVLACDDATPSNTHATSLPFRYKSITQPDTNAAWVAATTMGTAATASILTVIEFNAADLPIVSGVKYEYVKLRCIELADDPVLGGIIIIMDEPRYAEDVSDIVTA